MAKKLGFSAARAPLAYIRDNANVMYICASAPQSYSAATNQPNMIVSANVSSADFTIASAAAGPQMTVAAKNSQTIEGSGTGTHIALVTTSATRLVAVTNCSAQALSSGNTVNIGSFTITQNASATNS